MSKAWEVFDYEVGMYRDLYVLLRQGWNANPILGGCVRNALLESFLLHVRQLCELLIASERKWRTDIILHDLTGEVVPRRLGDLKIAYGTGKEGDAKWTLDKRLAHATTVRGASFDYMPMLNILGPALDDVIAQVMESRPESSQHGAIQDDLKEE